MIEDYTYNGLGLVSNITYTQDNTVKESYDYTYDNRGYITTESIINNYFSTAKNAAFSYTYDTIGRLTASAYTDNNTSTTSTTNYTYDAVGNRTSKTIGSATTTYTIGAYNQIASIGAAGETTSFTYDTHGNMTNETTVKTWTETQEGVNHSIETTTAKMYNYDSTNMMSSATVNINGISDEGQSNQNTWTDSAADTYIYNGDGQRVKKVADGITTKYYYSGSVVLYTADADNNKISGNIATPSGQIIATRDYANATNSDGSANTFANNYYFYHYDIRGSVTTLLKPDATIEQGYSYDEYGNATVENSASLFHNEMSYTGAISDSTTGLSYMNARYYNPATGTFTSQDTYYGSAYSPWTQHLYSYTGGNPVNYVDPTGHRYSEFATMEGEQNHKEAVVSFSQANYDSYKNERDKPKEDYVDGYGLQFNIFGGALIGISAQGIWDENGNTASLLTIEIGGILNVGTGLGDIYSHTNAKELKDLAGLSYGVGGTAAIGYNGFGISRSYDYVTATKYSGYNKSWTPGATVTQVFPVSGDLHFSMSISFIKYFDEAMLDYYAEYGTVQELNQQVEIVSTRLKNERNQK